MSAFVGILPLERCGTKQYRHSTTWHAHGDHHSRYWWSSPRWAQTYARYRRARAGARERRTTTIDGTDQTSALAPSLQRRRHGAHAAGTFPAPAPRRPSRLAQQAVSCFFEFFPERNSRFAVRRRFSSWCPTATLRCFFTRVMDSSHQQG